MALGSASVVSQEPGCRRQPHHRIAYDTDVHQHQVPRADLPVLVAHALFVPQPRQPLPRVLSFPVDLSVPTALPRFLQTMSHLTTNMHTPNHSLAWPTLDVFTLRICTY